MPIRLKEIRKAKGLSQTALADRAGLSKTHIGNIENGEANPTFEVMQKIAFALRTNVYDIFVPDMVFLTDKQFRQSTSGDNDDDDN